MQTSDEELVRRFQAGDECAFEDLVARWNAPLLHLAQRLTGDLDAARDVRQLALIQTYRRLHEFEGRCSLSTWLYRIVLNLSRDRHRTSSARARLEKGARERVNGHRVEPAPEHALARVEVSRRIALAVHSLPGPEREVLVLKHYHDLTFPAIAELLGAPVTTVKSRMTKGLRLLRTRLSELED